MTDDVVVTVVIPARNEEEDIVGCIEAIAAQDFDRDQMEVILADGASDDATVDLATSAAMRLGLDLLVVDNPGRTAATGLNAGLATASGNIIVRVDARSRISREHVALCVELLEDETLGAVGGGQRPISRPSAGVVGRGIVRSQRNRYSTGFARYRVGGRACSTDTVWMGAFPRRAVIEAGGWPTVPAQNQDYRLNQSLRARGLLVWFDPRLDAGYLPRPDLPSLARQFFRFGRAKGWMWARGDRPSRRQKVILTLPIAGLGGAAFCVARFGWTRSIAGGLVLALGLDAAGSDRSASAQERVASVVAMGVADTSWLAGVISGFVDGRRL